MFFILDILSQYDYIVNMIKKEKSWASKRVSAINRKIDRALNKNAMTENYIEEHNFICNSDAKNKKEYKEECLEYKQELENDFWHDYAQRKAY